MSIRAAVAVGRGPQRLCGLLVCDDEPRPELAAFAETIKFAEYVPRELFIRPIVARNFETLP